MSSPRSRRLPTPLLMLVTDRHRADLPTLVSRAVEGGVNAAQLREKDLPAGELAALARRLRGACGPGVLLLVNDRADVALLVGADGVHLGAASLPVAATRALLPPSMLVGRSVHTVNEARQAEQDGADYLLAGSIFPTASHPGREPVGPGFLAELKARVSLPVIAIGGITSANVGRCWEAGADGVAVIGALHEAGDPAAAARALLPAETPCD